MQTLNTLIFLWLPFVYVRSILLASGAQSQHAALLFCSFLELLNTPASCFPVFLFSPLAFFSGGGEHCFFSRVLAPFILNLLLCNRQQLCNGAGGRRTSCATYGGEKSLDNKKNTLAIISVSGRRWGVEIALKNESPLGCIWKLSSSYISCWNGCCRQLMAERLSPAMYVCIMLFYEVSYYTATARHAITDQHASITLLVKPDFVQVPPQELAQLRSKWETVWQRPRNVAQPCLAGVKGWCQVSHYLNKSKPLE